MTRKLTRKLYVLLGIAPFIAGLTLLIAPAALAQVPGPGPERGLVSPLHRNGFSAGPMDPAPLIFVPVVNYDPGGYQASSVAVADVNGDKKSDLVVTNCGGCYGPPRIGHDGSVGVLLGNGDGTFQSAVTYGSGGAVPVFVAVADLNGDGKPDLVVVNRNSTNIGVLLGNGDGTFQSAVTYGSAAPLLLAVADVNADGKPDLVVANECGDENCDGSVGVLLGNGDGTFQTAVTHLSGGPYAFAVAVADVNGDGEPDVLVANQFSVGVLLGNGDGTFQAAVTYPSGGNSLPPSSSLLAVADVNGDNNPDLVVESSHCCGSGNGAVGVLLGNGDGTFQPVVIYQSGAGGGGTSVAVADVNHDGKPDIVSTDQGAGADGSNKGLVELLLGNGDGTFQAAQAYSSGGFLTNSVAVADVNGDGKPDLLVANLCSDDTTYCNRSSVGVLLNNYGASPTTTSLVSSVNPAAIYWTVTYTATITPQSGGTVNGTVTFLDGFATLATVAVAGNQCAYSTWYATKGTHSITAIYSGELNRAAGSTSDVVEEVIKVPRASKTVVTTSGSPSLVGQPVTFTASVTSSYGTIPDGELVTFYDGLTAMASVALAGGVAAYTTSSLSAKPHTIKATYAGDAMFKPSSGKVMQVVVKYATTTTLTSNPNPSIYGHRVTFTATVTPSGPYTPTGRVKFWDGTTGLGTTTLSGGIATLGKSTLAVGTHSITAQYLGDAFSDMSTSPVLNQVVQ